MLFLMMGVHQLAKMKQALIAMEQYLMCVLRFVVMEKLLGQKYVMMETFQTAKDV